MKYVIVIWNFDFEFWIFSKVILLLVTTLCVSSYFILNCGFPASVFVFFGYAWPLLLHMGFLWLQRAGATLVVVCGLLIAVASLVAAQTRGWWASVVAVHGLGCSKARGSSWTPGPGIKPVSPMLAGGFLSTGLAGKSSSFSFIMCFVIKFAAGKLIHNGTCLSTYILLCIWKVLFIFFVNLFSLLINLR